MRRTRFTLKLLLWRLAPGLLLSILGIAMLWEVVETLLWLGFQGAIQATLQIGLWNVLLVASVGGSWFFHQMRR